MQPATGRCPNRSEHSIAVSASIFSETASNSANDGGPAISFTPKLVDDFYLDPRAVRHLALAQQYHEPPTIDRHNPQNGGAARRIDCTGEIADYAQARIESLIGAPIRSHIFQFRYTLKSFTKRAVCHWDEFDYTAVMYLALPEHCQGGTSFFRHKPTGHTSVHTAALDRYNFSDPDQWEEIDRVEMKFNRMILYPGNLFHSPTPPFFGDDIANGRLTQTMFIRV